MRERERECVCVREREGERGGSYTTKRTWYTGNFITAQYEFRTGELVTRDTTIDRMQCTFSAGLESGDLQEVRAAKNG